MSVTGTLTVAADGLYVPFRGFDREAGIVGTLQVSGSATGDAGGGTVSVQITMREEEFGFHPIWVPTQVSVIDDLAAAEAVNLSFSSAGNERLAATQIEALLSIRSQSFNHAAFSELGVAIDPDIVAGAAVLTAGWTTNTLNKVYQLRAYGVIFDGQALARGKAPGKAVPALLGGVR